MAHSKTSVESPFRRNAATVATVRECNFNLCLEFFFILFNIFLMYGIFIDLFSPFFFFFQVETVGMVKVV